MSALQRWRRRAAPQARLYCVGHAGTGAAAARSLADTAPEWLDVAGLRLPGRERRISEAPATNVSRLADDLADAICADGAASPRPTVLVGQCSGALIAFEVARRLVQRQAVSSCGLVVCSRGAPDTGMEGLDIEEFVAKLIALGGVHREVLEGAPEVLEMLLPVIRSDLRMMGGYRVAGEHRAELPILGVRGRFDELVSLAVLEGWGAWTSAGFATRELECGHFIFSEGAEMLMTEIADFTRSRIVPC